MLKSTRTAASPAALLAAMLAVLPMTAVQAQTPAAEAEAAAPAAAPAAEAAPAEAPAETPAPAAAPASGPVSAATVVATVNDEPITLGQMIAMKEGLHDGSTAQLPDTALWDLMLDQMIRQAAVAQVGAETETQRDRAVLELQRRNYLSAAALERLAQTEPTEAELRAVYDAAFGDKDAPKTEYSAAHILVKTEEEAKAIEKQLAEGADFGTLAEEKSTDNSGPNKGDLGWFTADMMVKPFADAVAGLEKGQVSAPVESQFGWHVIKLNDTRTQAAPEFDAIREQLAQQVRRDRIEAEIQKQVAAATIVKTPGLDASALARTELLDK